MVGADQAVMWGDLLVSMPVAPAGGRTLGLGKALELLAACGESVCLAQGVLRHSMAPEVGLVGIVLQERAAPKEPPFTVTPCS